MRAVAADGVTVDDEGMRQQLGAGAVLVGTFRAVQPMANERAVAVLQTRLAFATLHAAVLAPIADRSAMPRRLIAGLGGLGPAQFVQPVVVDAEVVGDLVHDGDLHFLDDLRVVVADVQQRVAVDRDGVRQ